MTEDRPEHTDPKPDLDAAGLDGALEAAYGMAPGEADDDASILYQLEQKGMQAPRVLLRDIAEETTPVLRPGTREAPGGRYQTVGEVARGGVGVILKCRDVDLGRDVAMKVLRSGHRDNEQLTARFVEEAQIAGQLQHPGIVPVYELGLTEEKQPYFTMKFVKGETLAARLANRESPAENLGQLLGIFQQVCMTIAYAHSRGVIHRDLKPANIIIGGFGEVMTVDWGFAKVMAHGGVADEQMAKSRVEAPQTIVQTVRTGSTPGSGSDSVAGSVMGTPAYMPPEQALGDVDSMDPRSDVFGLGAILCEILTGLPPYSWGELSPIVQAAQGRLDDAFQRLDACGADDALVSLCKRCLDVVPARRPSDGGAVGRAIADHQQGVEDRAQRARVAAITARRTRKWALVAAVALLLGFGVSTAAWRETEGARTTLAARNSDLELVAYASALQRAWDAVAAGDFSEVEEILDNTQPELRGFELEWLRMLGMAPPKPRIIETEGGRVTTLELSPDASAVVVADAMSNVSAWDVASGRNLWRVPNLGHSLAWTPDGGSVAALHIDGRLTVVNATTGNERARATVRTPAFRLAVSRDGEHLAMTSLDGWVSVLRMDTLALEHELEVGLGVREICCSPDGKRVLVTLPDQAVILDVATGKRGHSFAMTPRSGYPSHDVPATPTSVDWSSTGDRVLVCFDEGGSGIWFAETGLLDHELEPHAIRSINRWRTGYGRFCSATTAITAGNDRRVRVHDVGSGKRRAMIDTAGWIGSAVRGVRWRGPGTPIVTCGAGDRLFVWDIDALSPAEDIEDPLIASNVVCSADASDLFYVTSEGDLVRQDRATRRIKWARSVGRASWYHAAPRCCRYLPKAKAVVVVSRDLRLSLVDAVLGTVRKSIPAPESLVSSCSRRSLYAMGINVSADETRVSCAVGTSVFPRDEAFAAPVLVYDLGTDPRVRVVGRHMATALQASFVPDSDQVVSGGAEGDVVVWSMTRAAASEEPPVAVRTLSTSARSYVVSIDVSRDGRLVAVGRLDGRIQVYELETGVEHADRPITLHEIVSLVAFDPEKDRVLAIGESGTASLVDLSGVTLLRASLAFSRARYYSIAPNWSHLLATARRGGAVHVRPLRLPPDSSARVIAGREDGDDLSEARAAAFRAWRSSAGRAEARDKLRADPTLREQTRAAALEAVSHLGENGREISRRIRTILRRETVTPANRKTLMELLPRGLAAEHPASLGDLVAYDDPLPGYGELLVMNAVYQSPSGNSTALDAELGEAVLAACEDARGSVFEWLLLPRAVLAARRGDRPKAGAYLDRHRASVSAAASGGRGGPEPQLTAELRKEVEAFLAR